MDNFKKQNLLWILLFTAINPPYWATTNGSLLLWKKKKKNDQKEKNNKENIKKYDFEAQKYRCWKGEDIARIQLHTDLHSSKKIQEDQILKSYFFQKIWQKNCWPPQKMKSY